MRHQIQPRSDELIDATQFSAVEDNTLETPETSLAITVRSIGPVSADGTAVAEVAFQNIGKGAYRFPVSLEMKLLHAQGNVDRRRLLCAVQLFDTGGLIKSVATFSTYASVNDNNSWVQLHPKETLVVTFDPKFKVLFGESKEWKDRIASLDAGLMCYQTVLHNIPGKELERKYSSRTLKLESTNKVRLTVTP